MTRLLLLAITVAASGCELLGGPSTQSNLPSATAVQLTAAAEHSCALTSEGGVRCWGRNDLGQLGAGLTSDLDPDGDRGGRHLAVQVIGLETGVAAISSAADGSTTCALTTAGSVKCWGDGEFGALGNGTDEWSAVPVDVIGLERGVTAIAVGYEHACALIDAGGVKCWGQNEDGQLGNVTVESSEEPVDVVGIGPDVVALTAGGRHTCALNAAGGVSCWGDNVWGQCGSSDDDGTITSPTPVIDLTSGVARVVAGALHTCALTTTGGAKCWGNDGEGQLGNGDEDPGSSDERMPWVPVDVVGLTAGVDGIHPAGWYTMARVGGAVKQWGSFAEGPEELEPIDSAATSGVAQVATGNMHACYIDVEGGVWCWGDNNTGAVGFWDVDDTIHRVEEPIRVDSLP